MFWNAIMMLVMMMAAQGTKADELYHMSDEFIAEINAEATTWRAARNFPKDTDEFFLKSLTCAWINETATHTIEPYEGYSEVELPEQFDARTEWNDCATLKEIRNQGHCGSCWAVSSASVISDRLCIQKGLEFRASSEDIASCCRQCGNGCRGGWPFRAFEYFCDVGVVSGGSYKTGDGCKPYSKQIFRGKTPSCVKKCTNRKYHKSYRNDRRRGSKAYGLNGEMQIKQDLYKNGPMTVVFNVYQDFFQYRRGVYRHTKGRYCGDHAVRLIGWGEENETPYWLIANSWGAGWGDRGTFKFLRGSDHCNIEHTGISAAMM